MSTLAVGERPRIWTLELPLRRVPEFLGVALQLALALLVIEQFRLESRTFYYIAALATGGFVVNAVLPLRLRLPFFAALSLTSLAVALGVAGALIVATVGTVLVGICHLRLALRWRLALLAAVGALLAAMRGDVAAVTAVPGLLWPRYVWPVVGSIFMFRLALYLHALETEEERPTATQAAAYFAMLPNVSFPLFPVVDFTTFRRTHYDQDAIGIYQTGARWIARGLVQLLLYRYVYYNLVRDPSEVETLGDLVTFLLATFGLYLRVSGQFHLVAGMLHLFGFRLPETHKMYFLSSGFTDFWRRINIYWKDFMMKLVYYPSFFRLRRFGPRVALGGATAIVFFATWLLHAYQWFWLRGGFPITWPDSLFWGILGLLVLWTALREASQGRNRQLGAKGWSLPLALRVVGTFWVICTLWALWSAESVADFVSIWSAAAHVDRAGVLLLVGVVGVHLAVGGRNWTAPKLAARQAPWWHDTLKTASVLALVLLAGRTHRLYADAAPTLSKAVASMHNSRLNRRDQALRHKGYYEKLANVNRFGTQVWEVTARRPADIKGLSEIGGYRASDSWLGGAIVPSHSTTYYRKPFTSNRWGMRDRDYALAKPPGTWRVALLGASQVMGTGVTNDETIDAILENRMNRELAGAPHARYEILNFAAPGYAMTQEAAILEERGLAFRPDVVIMTLDPAVFRRAVEHLTQILSRGVRIPDDTIRALVEREHLGAVASAGYPVPNAYLRRALGALGVRTRVPWSEAQLILGHHALEINRYVIRKVAREVTAAGAVPVLLGLDQVGDEATDQGPLRPLMDEARRAGFLVLNLYDVYDGHDRPSLQLAPEWDHHPNAAADTLIADRLFDEFQQRREALRLASPTTVP